MKFNVKILAISLILICCLMGAASAAEDVSADVVDVADDSVAVDAVSDDVSDSLESVDDEAVVDESAPAQDEIDDVELEASVDDEPALDEVDDELSGQSLNIKSTKNLLGDGLASEIYVTTTDELENAYDQLISNQINGIIYLADGTYEFWKCKNYGVNITFIGQGENVLFTSFNTVLKTTKVVGNKLTFINLTFNNLDLTMSSDFINCSFVNSNINIAKGVASIPHLDETPFGVTHNLTFDNCEFKNIDTTSSVFTIYKYGKVVLTNCTFDNIVADSIVVKDGEFIDQDGIYFYDCKFANCNVKGVVDIPGNIEIADYCAIENCDYDFDATTDIAMVDEYSHNYLNATKLKVVAVDSAVDISSSEKGVVVITLTDGANPIAGATVKYTVNDGEEQTVTTGDDGKATISGLTGEVTIAVNYEGNESFNAISDTKSFNFTEEPVVPPKVATKITAPKVTATYNVAKKLVITLTDKNGKALANKKVTVKVGTISKTLSTNAKGQVSLNVATLVPKTYTATVKFAGDDAYLASSVSPKVVVSKAKPQIVAKAKTFKVKTKTKKYTVTLKNNKGKVLKKVKLTLKVGKKTYKATTNSKGKATFKITKLTKKGKYTATIKFAGSKYYKALSKKAKITVKK